MDISSWFAETADLNHGLFLWLGRLRVPMFLKPRSIFLERVQIEYILLLKDNVEALLRVELPAWRFWLALALGGP